MALHEAASIVASEDIVICSTLQGDSSMQES